MAAVFVVCPISLLILVIYIFSLFTVVSFARGLSTLLIDRVRQHHAHVHQDVEGYKVKEDGQDEGTW